MTIAIERRDSVRHETVNRQTSVQFMDCTERQITESKLVNFSESGALIVADKVPVLHRLLWVRVENRQGAGWIAAETVRFGRSNEVAIRFFRPCPPSFFLGATRRESIRSVAADEKETPFVDEELSEYSAREYP